MIRRRNGGPAPSAGPLFILGLTLFVAVAGLAGPRPAEAVDWIPPSRVTALLPGATIAPGVSRTITLTLRANGAGASLAWSATSGGSFAAGVAPASGLVAVPAGGIATVDLTVTVPALAAGTSSISVDIVEDQGGARIAKVGAAIQAATDGRPEVLPVPSTWSAPSGTSGSVAFQVRSTIGTSETVLLTAGRFNPDPNNAGGLFTGGAPPANAVLPGDGTITVNVPATIPARAWGATPTRCSSASPDRPASRTGSGWRSRARRSPIRSQRRSCLGASRPSASRPPGATGPRSSHRAATGSCPAAKRECA